MPKLKRSILGLLLAAGLTACAQGSVSTLYVGSYDPIIVDYIVSRGAMYTEVLGNPFSAPPEALESAVTRAMSGANPGQPIRFATELEEGSGRSPYRVVVAFNPGPGVSGYRLCLDEPGPAGAAAGEIRVIAVFCARERQEISVRGSLPQASGPGDPALGDLLRRMTAELFPRRNPDIPGGGTDYNT